MERDHIHGIDGLDMLSNEIFQTGQVKKAVTAVIIILALVGLTYVLTAKKEIKQIMIIKSSAFENNAQIPQVFTCNGKNINPEFIFENIPEGTESLAFIMDDPDASRGVTFNHWLVWNISPRDMGIAENSVPTGAMQGKNDAGKIGYSGPCPPPGKPHHYRFKLFAVKNMLNIPEGSSAEDIENAIDGDLIEKAELVGIYSHT